MGERVRVINSFSIGSDKLRNYTIERRDTLFYETSYNDRVILCTVRDRGELVDIVKRALATYLSGGYTGPYTDGNYQIRAYAANHSLCITDRHDNGFYWDGYSDTQLQQIVACL